MFDITETSDVEMKDNNESYFPSVWQNILLLVAAGNTSMLFPFNRFNYFTSKLFNLF
jgi:hypothetical protein